MFLNNCNLVFLKASFMAMCLVCSLVGNEAFSTPFDDGWRLFVRVDNRPAIRPLPDINRSPGAHLNLEGGGDGNWTDSGYMSVFEVTEETDVMRAIRAGRTQSRGQVYHFIAVAPGTAQDIDLAGGVRIVNDGSGPELERVAGNVWGTPAGREFRIYKTSLVDVALGPGEFRTYPEHLISGTFPTESLFANQANLRPSIVENGGICNVSPQAIITAMLSAIP